MQRWWQGEKDGGKVVLSRRWKAYGAVDGRIPAPIDR